MPGTEIKFITSERLSDAFCTRCHRRDQCLSIRIRGQYLGGDFVVCLTCVPGMIEVIKNLPTPPDYAENIAEFLKEAEDFERPSYDFNTWIEEGVCKRCEKKGPILTSNYPLPISIGQIAACADCAHLVKLSFEAVRGVTIAGIKEGRVKSGLKSELWEKSINKMGEVLAVFTAKGPPN